MRLGQAGKGRCGKEGKERKGGAQNRQGREGNLGKSEQQPWKELVWLVYSRAFLLRIMNLRVARA